MKQSLKFILVLLWLMALASCRHYEYPLVLQEADSLCSVLPDSAVALLRAIADGMAQADEHVQMRYKLLTIKANDKAYITHTSDSLILTLVDYYKYGGDKAYLGEAYYYAGSTYRDLGDAPRALDYYQKALDAMPGDENLKVKSKVYAQMGELYQAQYLYKEAIMSYRESYQCDILLKDTIGMIYNLRDMGFAYRGLDKPDSTLFLLNKAHELALSINNELMGNRITSQMASLYIRIGDLEKAKSYIQPSLEMPDKYNISSIYSIAADIYYQIGEIDSAAYYYEALLDRGTIYAKRNAYYKLAHISQQYWRDSKKALGYIDQFKNFQDTINSITATESVAQMNSLYNYQLTERENTKLQIQRQNYYILFLSTSLVAIVMLIIGYYLTRWYIQRQRKYRDTLNRILTEVYRKTDAYIEKKKLEIEEVERILGDLSFDDELERNHQERRRESLQMEMERAKAEQELQKKRDLEILHSDVQEMLNSHVSLGNILRADDWAKIEQTLDNIYPGFTVKLKTVNGMTDIKYQVSLLTKLHQRNIDIATLVNRTPSAITRIKTRFVQELGISNPNINFDEFIHSL